jgi:hypothetical protein
LRERRKTIKRVFSEFRRIMKRKDKYCVYFALRDLDALEKVMLGDDDG